MRLRYLLPLAALALAAARPAAAQQTMVFPHFVERTGSVATMPWTFDTNLYVINYRIGGEMELFLKGTDGLPLKALGGAAVCDPCHIPLVKRTLIRLEDLITGAGGMPAPMVSGFIEIRLKNGASFDGLAVQALLVNSHSSQFDLSYTALQATMVTQ
ncbi:MAG TPA: hypothetical protein VJT67_02730 [Longimicrobiaceae bacterium]|nr:hypothetical protein [Longimicrobiaceae bacterium]